MSDTCTITHKLDIITLWLNLDFDDHSLDDNHDYCYGNGYDQINK